MAAESEREGLSPGRILAWVALAAVLGSAALFRFSGLLQRGVIDTIDCWKYLVTGKQWADGHYVWMNRAWHVPDGFFRPAVHALHAITIRLLGYNDHSIKIVNSALDLAAMGLMYLILVRLSRNRWMGIIAVILYAFLPKAQEFAWCEMPHTPTLFLVLLAMYLCLIAGVASRGLISQLCMLFAAGCCIGLCAQMHPDLAVIAPGYVASILLVELARGKWFGGFLRFVRGAAVFSAGFAFPYLFWMLCFGPATVVGVIRNEFSTHAGMYAGKAVAHTDFVLRTIQVLHHATFGLFQERLLILYLFVAALLVALTRSQFKVAYDPRGYMAPLLVLSYAVGYALLIGDFPERLDRLFMPLVPVLLITIVYWAYTAGHALMGRWAVPALCVLFLGLACYNPHMTPGMVGTGRFAPERERIVYDAMKGKVDEHNRMLISPVVTLLSPGDGWGGPWGLANGVYFGKDALYIADLPNFQLPYRAESLEKAWRENNVKYFMLALINSQMQWLPFFPAFQKMANGSPYSIDEEMKVVFPFFALAGARKLAQPVLPQPDAVYELFQPKPFKQWDFTTLAKARWDWGFSKEAQGPTPEGALLSEATGKMVVLSLHKDPINADAVKGIRIECSCKAPDGSLRPPASVDLSWATQATQGGANAAMEFSGPVQLLNPDPNRPTIYVACMDGARRWAGSIGALSLRVLPAGPSQDATSEIPVAIRSIALYTY